MDIRRNDIQSPQTGMHEVRHLRSTADGAKNVFVITLNMIPRPWTSPRVCRGHSFSKHTRTKKSMQAALKGAYDGPLISSACICEITFYMPIPASMPKYLRERALKGLLRPSKKPDRTNMCKLAEDALEGIVLSNDSLIVGGNVEKYYGAEPKIVYLIEILQ